MKSSKDSREPAEANGAMRLNLRMLEIFVQVADRGSMSAAGEQLGVSQAAISQAITALEESLGVQLLDRSVRPPALTLAGSSVLKSARGVVAKVQEVQDAARNAALGRVPLLRIGMLDSFTSTAGAQTLDRLRDIASEWTVASGYRATSFQAVLDRRSDVIITSEDGAAPESLAVSTILTESFMLAVPADWPGDPADLSALAGDLSYIRYGRDSHMGAMIDAYFQRAGVQPVTRYQFDTTDALLRMVAAGFGWTIVTPLILLKSMAPANKVRVLPLPRGTLRRRLVVAVRKGEGAEILARVRKAALEALRESVLPQIEGLIPDAREKFVVGGGGRAGGRA